MKKEFISFIGYITIPFLAISCNKPENQEYSILNYPINENEVLTIEKDKYLVLFYSPNCLACQDTIMYLNTYNGEFSIFVVNVLEIDSNYYNSVNKVPTLFFVYNHSIYKEISGFKNIRQENLYIFFK